MRGNNQARRHGATRQRKVMREHVERHNGALFVLPRAGVLYRRFLSCHVHSHTRVHAGRECYGSYAAEKEAQRHDAVYAKTSRHAQKRGGTDDGVAAPYAVHDSKRSNARCRYKSNADDARRRAYNIQNVTRKSSDPCLSA